MTNYSSDDASVRAMLFIRRTDGFQGKWKYEIALNMRGFYNEINPIEAVRKAWLAKQFNEVVPSIAKDPIDPEHGFFLVVPDPYHKSPYPVMIEV